MSEEKYQRLIKIVELHNIELESLECSQNKKPSDEEKMDVALRTNLAEKQMEENRLRVQIQFKVIAYNNRLEEDQGIEDIDDENILFNISFCQNIDYILDLTDEEDISRDFEEEINTFIEKNVQINAWPYAREMISSITTRMGFPALIIPTNKNVRPF